MYKFATKPLLLQKKNSTSKKIFIRLRFLGALWMQICNEQKFFIRKSTDDKTSVYIVDTIFFSNLSTKKHSIGEKFLLYEPANTSNKTRNSILTYMLM